MTDKKKKETLKNLIRAKERINKLFKEIFNLAVITDFEEFVKERSLKELGEVKDKYSVEEASKVLGITRQAIYYHIRTGRINIINGKLSFEDLVILAARSLD
jgi:predicted DNA-binding protein YlxM (UPF0122 family)